MCEKEGLNRLKPYVDKEYERICKDKRRKEDSRAARNSFYLSWEDDGGSHGYINFRNHGESVDEFVLRSLKEIIDFESKANDEKSTETDHA